MGETRAFLGQGLDQQRRMLGDPLHVARVLGMEHPAGNPVADLEAIGGHFRPLAEHLAGHFVFLRQHRRRPLLAGQLQRHLPAHQRHLPRHLLGEHAGFRTAVAQAQKRQRRAETEEAHAVAALAEDFLALLRQRQAVDLHHVVEHPGEHPHHLAEALPVEARLLGEGFDDEAGEVDRAEQAGAVGR
ncbi:hypothetical protein D9M71_184920 [compost metagenome]